MRTLVIPALVMSGVLSCIATAQSPRAFIAAPDNGVQSYDLASVAFLRTYGGLAGDIPLFFVSPENGVLKPGNRFLWMPNSVHDESFGGVYILDTVTGDLTRLQNRGNITSDVVFSRDGKTAYVAAPSLPTVYGGYVGVLVVDTASLTITTVVPPRAGASPFGLALSPDGRRLYLSSKRDADSLITVFDAATLTPIADIPAAAVQGRKGPHIVLSPDGERLFVSCSAEIDFVDTLSLAVTAKVKLPGAPNPDSNRIAITPDGTRLFAALYQGSEVDVIDTSTAAVSRRIAVSVRPQAIAVTPDGKSAWAAAAFGVTTIDTASYAQQTYQQNRYSASFVVFDNPPQTLDFAPPGLTAFRAQDIGNTQIGASFTATSTFAISAAGIKFNPFGNQTSQPKTNELDVFVYQMVGNSRGSLLATGSLCRNGPCPQTVLFPSNGYPGTPVFFDVPLNFTFLAGQTYLIEFGVRPNGWGYGLTAKNWVEFYNFDPGFANTPPSKGGSPFTVGPARVLDGAFGADLQNKSLPHIRLVMAAD